MFKMTNSLSEVLYINSTYTGLVMTFITTRYIISKRNNTVDQYSMVSTTLIKIVVSDNDIVLNRHITHLHE